MIYFYAILTIAVILSIRKKKENEVVFDKASTTALKGIMCLYILLHNLGLDYAGNSEAARIICDHSGTVAVSVFFFLSGYGVFTGYLNNGEKFLKKLLLNNAVRLYVISVFINAVIYLSFFRGQLETKDLLLKLFNLDFFNNFNRMNRHGWFIPTIITMYLIFSLAVYLCSKLKNKHNVLIGVIIVAFIALSLRICAHIFDNGGMYTKGLPCFGLGLLYAYFKPFVDKYSNKYCWLITSVGLVASAVSFIFFWAGAAGYIMNFIIVAISTKYRYDNKVILFIGKISLGIYLFLYLSSLILQKFLYNQYLWVIFNTLLIFALSIAMHYLIELVVWFFKKPRLKCNKIE